jgi:uncharacterized membrane protein
MDRSTVRAWASGDSLFAGERTMDLSEWLRAVAQVTGTVVESIGILIVVIALVRAMPRYATLVVRLDPTFPPEGLRLELGRSLALALEFLLGADIIRTAVEPTWDEIGRLAAIAAIRTGLNFFLQRELTAEAYRTERAPAP